jgi:hypothetical protein
MAMKKKLFALCALSTLVGIAGPQQVNSSSSASGSSNTSVSAGRSGANVQSDSRVDASNQTSVAADERHSDVKETKKAKEAKTGRSNDQKAGEAAGGLAEGTTVNAVLAKSLDSSKCKPGDPVSATAAQDVKADGKVIIRGGSHLIGHVTEAKPKGAGEANSSLGIVFDHAVLKGGQQVPMNSVVQALAAANTSSGASIGDDSFGAVGGGNAGGAGNLASRGGGGLLGGVASTAGATSGAVANVGGGATGTVGSTVGSTASVGGGLQGVLSSTSSGVIGLKGLSLASNAANSTQGSVITSPGKSVHLDSGTQMVLRVVNP